MALLRLGSKPPRQDTGGGLGQSLEKRFEKPVFFIVLTVMVARGAQIFSGGVLNIQALLGPVWFPRFEMITGAGMALGSEMLMSLAGRNWRTWNREAAEIAARPGLSKTQRVSLVNQARANGRNAFVFMLIGAASSLYTGIAFLLSTAGTRAQQIQDIVICVVITGVILYLGVFRETSARDAAESALDELDASMNDALQAAVARFKGGNHTDQDTRFIAEHLPAHRQARFRRAVAKADTGRYWTAAQVADELGIGRDAGEIRRLNRQVNALAKEPANGVTKASNGRTWIIPHAVVMDTWGEAMADYRAMRRIGEKQAAAEVRTPGGQPGGEISALP